MPTTTKVFEIQLKGNDSAQQGIKKLGDQVQATADQIATLKAQLGSLQQSGGDSTAIANLTKQIKDLQTAQKGLSTTQQQAQTDAVKQAQLENLLSQAKLKDAQASKTAQQEEAGRIASQIQQEKELDRQIALEQKNTKAINDTTAALQAQPGSYAEIVALQKQLRPLIQNANQSSTISFQGQNINFQQAIEQYQKLSFAEQAFRRQFQADGTLVSEYSAGIINAFKKLGVTDIFTGQITKAREQITALQAQTEQLVSEFKAAGESGGTSLAELGGRIEQNVAEIDRLTVSVERAESQLKGVGGIGTEITTGLANGFKNVRDQLGQFILFYFGFQQAFLGVQALFEHSVDEFQKGEQAANALANALKTVGASKQDLQALNAQVDNLTHKFKSLDSTDLRQAQEKLVSFNKLSRDQILSFLPLIVDFAKNQNKTIEESTDILLKSLTGKGQGIQQLGIQLTKDASVTQRFSELQKQLAERVTGSAEAFEKGASGQLADYHEAIVRIEEEVGSKFVPALANAAIKLIPYLQGLASILITVIKFITAIPFGSLVAGIIAIKIAFALYREEVIATNVAQQSNNATTLLGFLRTQAMRLGLIATTTATKAKTVATEADTVATEGATVATEEFNVATKASPLGLILTLFAILIPAVSAFGTTLSKTTKDVDDANEKLKATAQITGEINEAVAKDSGEQINKISNLVAILHDNNTELSIRKKAYDELVKISPAFIGTVNDEYNATAQLDQVYQRLITRIYLLAEARAEAAVQEKIATDLLEKQAEVFDKQQAVEGSRKAAKQSQKDEGRSGETITGQSQEEQDNKNAQEELDKSLADEKKLQLKQQAFLKLHNDDIAKLQKGITDARANIVKLAKDNSDGAKKEIVFLQQQIKDNQDALALLLGEQEPSKLGSLAGEGPGRIDKLTPAEENAFKRLDAIRDAELLKVETWRAKIEISRKLTLDEERIYLDETLDINQQNLSSKSAILDKVQHKNSAELLALSQFNKGSLDFQLQHNKDLASAYKEEFDILDKALQGELDNQNLRAKAQTDLALQDPNLTNVEKLKLQEAFLDQTLANQLVFNKREADLEAALHQSSVDGEIKRKNAIQKILNDEVVLRQQNAQAIFKDIQESADKQIDIIKIGIEQQTIDVLKSKDSYYQQSKALDVLAYNSQKAILQTQLEADKKAVAEALIDKTVSEKDYLDKLTKFKTDEAALYKLTADQELTGVQLLTKAIKELADSFSENVLGIKNYTKELKDSNGNVISTFVDNAQKIKDAVKQTEDTVKQTIQTAEKSFFDSQNKQIDAAKQNQLDYLQREQDRVDATSQSAEETATIQREFDQKRKQADIDAAKAHKKVALEQATIDFASSVVKSLAQYGLPLALLPIAAITALYLVQRAAINSQQFAKGGRVGKDGNGLITQSPNIAPQRNGDNILATVRQGEVILNEHQQRALGGREVFRSIGVPGFAAGGSTLGTSLKAPIFSASSFQNNSVNLQNDGQAKTQQMLQDLMDVVYTVDQKPVVLNTNKVTQAQAKTRKDVSIGVI